jgi:tRNA A-37 threonylcarbamoyl transferase component Bud32
MPARLGRYTLETRIATGGMAEVFLARQTGPQGFQKVCVVKRMLPNLGEDEGFVRMFLDEARLAAQLNHPNIAQIFDFGQADGSYFLAMEYVPGCSLRRIVKDHGRRGAYIPPHLCARIASEAAAALHAAHTAVDANGGPLRVIHRDVSPQNILLGNTGVVKLIDFGVAKATSGTHQTRTGMVKGKFAYMSPEQIRGQPLDARSDLYALGLVLYELLASRRAIEGENDVAIVRNAMQMAIEPLSTVRFDVPPGLQAVVDRALQREREERFQTAAELGQALDHFLATSGRTVSPSELAALVVDDVAPLAPGEVSPASLGAGVVQKASSGAFWENAANAPTIVVGSAAGETRASVHDATTRARPAPANLLAQLRESDPAAVPTLEDTGSRPAGPLPFDESSSAMIRRAVRPHRAPWILAGLGAATVAAAAVLWSTRPATHPPAPPAEPAPAPAPPPATTPLEAAPAPPAESPHPPPARPEHIGGVLVATSMPSMGIKVDGRARGHTPARVQLPPGEHTLSFEDERLGLAHTVPIKVGREGDTRADWRPSKGTVLIRATPYAEVFLGDRSLGLTPLNPIELWEGRHTFRFVNADTRRTESREVEVQPGAQVLVKVDLRPQ